MVGALVLYALFGPPVRLEGTAARLPVLLQSIGEQVGTKLVCDSELAGCVVYGQFSRTSLDDAKAMLAKALDGRWVEKDGASELVPDEAALRDRRASYRGRFAELCREQVAAARRMIPQELDDKQVAFVRSKLAEKPEADGSRVLVPLPYKSQRPGSRLVFDALATIDFSMVCPLSNGACLHFSTVPTKVFEKLELSSDRLAQYDREQATWDAQASNQDIADPWSASLLRGSKSNRPTGRVYLAVSRQNRLPMFVVSCVIVDIDGNEKETVSDIVTLSGFDRSVTSGNEATVQGEFVVPSTLTRRYHDLLDLMNSTLLPLPATDPLYPFILDPVDHEPLDLWVADALKPMASLSSGNLVAPLDDELVTMLLEPVSTGRSTTLTIESILRDRLAYEIDRSEARTVMRFVDPDHTTDANFSRTDLKALLKELDQQGFLELESYVSRFPIRGLASGWNAILFYTTRAIVPGYERSVQRLNNGVLCLLQCLNPSERSTLYAGGTLTAGQLTPASIKNLNDLIHQFPEWGYSEQRRPGGWAMNLRVPMALPDGVTAQTKLSGRSTKSPGFCISHDPYEDFTAWTSFGDAEEQAAQLGQLYKRNVGVKFWFGEMIEFTLSVDLPDGNLTTASAQIPRIDMRNAPGKLSDLPPAIQKAIQDARDGGGNGQGRR